MIASHVRALGARLAAHLEATWQAFCVGIALAAILATASCSKAALTAPTSSSISLFSNPTIVPVNGTAQITAQVFASGGIPVHNGTVVDFKASFGTLSPSEARTNNGQCTVLFYPGSTSGKATVRAFSGGINSGDLPLTIAA